MMTFLEAILILGACHRLYRSAVRANRWSTKVFRGSLLGVAVAAATLIGAMVYVMSLPGREQGLSILALAVAYLAAFAAIVVWSNRTFRVEMALRRRTSAAAASQLQT